jgi:hypothetical protein
MSQLPLGMPKCDFCSAPAEADLFAQWTVADFLTLHACWDHLTRAEFRVMHMRVDGVGVQLLRWTYYRDSPNYVPTQG